MSPLNLKIKKPLHKKEEVSVKLTSSHPSATAARISTVPTRVSRLPGFIGLVPPPALDKKNVDMYFLKSNLDYDTVLN